MTKPIALTSILPFGVVKKDGTKWYRFSVTVDLPSVYPEGANPDLRALRNFLYHYGVGANSIYRQIINNLEIDIKPRETTKPPPAWRPCFPQSFDEETVESHWHLLFGTGTAQEVSVTGLNESSTRPFTPNPLTGKTVAQFQKAEDPSAVFSKLVAAQKDLSIAHEEAEMRGFDNAARLSKQLIESIEKESGNLLDNIERTARFLRGFDNFAQPRTSDESANFFHAELRRIANPNELPENVLQAQNSILETFSFLNSNIILQRLFGTTIDFEIAADELGLPTTSDGELSFEISANFKAPVFNDDVEWKHLKSSMKHYQQGTGSAVLVSRTIRKPSYVPVNYDFGAKLRSLHSLDEKLKGIKKLLDQAKTESEFYAVRKELISLDSAALTRGMNLYNNEIEVELNEILKATAQTLTEERITRGFRFGVLSRKEGSSQIISLGSRKVELIHQSGTKLPDEFKIQEFAAHTDTGAHALVESTKGVPTDLSVTVEHKIVVDNCVLTWSGENIGMPSVFSNHETDKNLEAKVTEGSISASTDIVTTAFARIFKEEFFPKSVQYSNVSHPDIDESAEKPITLQYRFHANAKLILGDTHDVCASPEYKNGWGVRFNTTDVSGDGSLYELGYDDLPEPFHTKFEFKRNEPVKPVCFYLQDPLFEQVKGKVGFQTPAEDRDGETLHRLVIRNYNPYSDTNFKTHQKSIRYVLPPPISFQLAFWHGKIFEMHRRYGKKETYRWYKKHHFPINENYDKPNGSGKYTYEDSIEGSTRMKEFYPDRWYVPDSCETSEIINYLPDPLSSGFRLEFFLDNQYTIKASDYEEYEQNEYYFTGKYPYIRAWKIIVEDKDDQLVESSDEEIRIRVSPGTELYVRARTLLSDGYEAQFETFGNYNDFTKYGGNDLLSPPLDFSIIHATQRPLVRAKLDNTLSCAKELGKSFVTMTNTVNLEQLGLYRDYSGIFRYIKDRLPTGSVELRLPTGRVELYAKWEEYVDDPNHQTTDDWTPDQPINKVDLSRFYDRQGQSSAVFETALELSEEQLIRMEETLNRVGDDENEVKNFAVDMKAAYDVKSTKYIEKWFWIKNQSRFTAYYPQKWRTKEETKQNDGSPASADTFNKISSRPFLIRILNSKKPGIPIMADRNIILLSVVEDLKTGSKTTRTASMRRFRFYFERNRLTSGKGERIGFVVNETRSKYNDYLAANRLVSAVGRDIVSDSHRPYDGLFRNEDVFLTKSNFVIHDPFNLSAEDDENKSGDLESFSPKYVEELGIMTYLPRFDKKLNLWYLDVELDINDETGNELHSPFLRFGMVHYQEHSFNYNKGTEADLQKDCRISEIKMSGFVYLLGTRTLYIDRVSRKELKIKISANDSSLIHHSSDELCTRFFAFIEGKPRGDISWRGVPKGEQSKVTTLINQQTSLIRFERESGYDYRLVILETEYWGSKADLPPALTSEIYENEKNRIVLVSTFDL